jgi:hypothetical protein
MSQPGSSHRGNAPEQVNPYAASHVGDPQQENVPSGRSETARDYHLRLSWSDRRWLLRSVAPGRLSTILIAVFWVKSSYDILVAWGGFLARDRLSSAAEVGWLILAAGNIAQGGLSLYVCWLSWREIDFLRGWAGGTADSLGAWSRLTYRITWLGALSAILGVVGQAQLWFMSR